MTRSGDSCRWSRTGPSRLHSALLLRRAGLLPAVLLLTCACATPIGVTHVSAQSMYRPLTSSVLSGGRPSQYSDLSELSFYNAVTSGKPEYFLAPAVYAYAFALGKTDEGRIDPIDPAARASGIRTPTRPSTRWR